MRRAWSKPCHMRHDYDFTLGQRPTYLVLILPILYVCRVYIHFTVTRPSSDGATSLARMAGRLLLSVGRPYENEPWIFLWRAYPPHSTVRTSPACLPVLERSSVLMWRRTRMEIRCSSGLLRWGRVAKRRGPSPLSTNQPSRAIASMSC